MLTTNRKVSFKKWLRIFWATGLLVFFFLPWAAWRDTIVSGYYMPAGKLFQISAAQFKLDNPFPQLNFTFYLFWLIPFFAILIIILAWQHKKTYWLSIIAGTLALWLVTVFFLFTQTLADLGAGRNAFQMLRIPAYLCVIFATGLIFTAHPSEPLLKKIGWVLTGPVFAFLAFKFIEKKVRNETHTATDKAKTEFTLSASELIREFAANDSAANYKYREKMLVIHGVVSQANQQADSTVNLRFMDTSKHFINVSIDKADYERTKNIKPGDEIAIKGSCSGSTYSMILDSTIINFKRSTLFKKTEK